MAQDSPPPQREEYQVDEEERTTHWQGGPSDTVNCIQALGKPSPEQHLSSPLGSLLPNTIIRPRG